MGPHDEVIAKTTASNSFTFSSLNHSSFFQIKLFYVRISSCLIDSVPNHLTLRHRQIRLSPDINGSHSTAASDAPPLTLRRDRVDRDSAEVTYVTTDTVCVTGSLEFEVYEKEGMLLFLCGSLERLEGDNGNAGSSLGWEIECHVVAGSIGSGSSRFMRSKLGASARSVEVYVAGCCSGVPVILSKTIRMSSRRRVSRHVTLDAIPEDEEMMMMMRTEKEHEVVNGMITHGKLKVTGSEDDDYDSDGKMKHGFYTQEMYAGEDGQLTWFNAGVRVGVGIGLGMCLGIGVGVGLLMRSYQTTTRNLKRRFF